MNTIVVLVSGDVLQLELICKMKTTTYKKFTFYEIDNSFSVSESEVWLPIIFDTIETGKMCIRLRNKFVDNFYNVISDLQSKAIKINEGIVTAELIKTIPLK